MKLSEKEYADKRDMFMAAALTGFIAGSSSNNNAATAFAKKCGARDASQVFAEIAQNTAAATMRELGYESADPSICGNCGCEFIDNGNTGLCSEKCRRDIK